MPARSAPLPDELGPVFSTRSAREHWVKRARLLGPDLERPFRGVYRRLDSTFSEARADPAGSAASRPAEAHPAVAWRERQMSRATALTPLLPTGHFFCGRTAAVIWGLPVPVGSGEGVEVACFSPGRALRRSGVRGSRIDPRLARAEVRHGLPVSDPATTWCMLAPQLRRRDAVSLGDAVIRRARIPGTSRLERVPHATLEQLELTAALPHRRGRELLLETLPLLSPHSASAPETHLRLLLREWGLPRPELDFDVYGDDGRLLGCSEFAFPEYRVLLEYEGDHHRTDPAQWHRDVQKHRDYVRAGWDPVRITSQLLYRLQTELRGQILDALTRGGWAPPR